MAIHALEPTRPPTAKAVRAPLPVRLLSPLLTALVGTGMPLGYNGLITIRGRSSGQPRTAAVAILPANGCRWVWAPWGDVHWVLNLRAARRATITVRRRSEEVIATELDEAQRVEFFRDVLGPVARGIPFGASFIRVVDGVDLADPADAARRTRVFELRQSTGGDGSSEGVQVP